jgi:hypothetical protein
MTALTAPPGATRFDLCLARLFQPCLFALVALALFVVAPFLTLALLLALAFASRHIPRWFLLLTIVLCSAYLGLVNVTKLPESDLEVYFQSFEDARKLDLPSFLLLNGREPLYYVSLYYFSNLPGVDTRLYVFLSTLVPYVLFLGAMLALCERLRIERKTSLSLLLVLAFFPQLFSLSAHLMRQFLASALMMAFLAELACRGRRRWKLGLSAAMVHYSAFLVLALSVVKKMRAVSGVRTLPIYAIALFGLYALAVLVAPYLLNVPILGLIFGRIANGEGADLEPLTLVALATAGLFLVIAVYSLGRAGVDSPAPEGEWAISLSTITICAVVLISSAQPMLSEIATRYFFYLYFLIGLVLPFVLSRFVLAGLLVRGLAVLAIPMFFLRLSGGGWHYADVSDLLFAPGWLLWTHLG